MKIVAFYTDSDSGRGGCSPACITKVDYIVDCLLRMDYKIDILSLSTVSVNHTKQSAKSKAINDRLSLHFPRTFSRRNCLERIAAKILFPLTIRKFLKKNINEGDTVYLYHSSVLYHTIAKVLKKRHAKVILDVEEIYGDVKNDIFLRKKEFDFFKIADAFIFPTSNLNKIVNTSNKPFAISHGTYKAIDKLANRLSDGKIHCVYAGTLNEIKGGAYAAVDAGMYLNDNYHIHILGFGSDSEKKRIIERICSVTKKTKCKVTYDGVRSGDDYLKFIQCCHIGLSTQNPKGQYNDSSFPSKILSYLSNGLRVVTINIPVVSNSEVGKYLFYYDKNDPLLIAKAIQSIDFNKDFDGRAIVSALDISFIGNLEKCLEAINKTSN